MDTLDACPLHARLAAAVLAACPLRHPRRFLRPLDPPRFSDMPAYGSCMEASKAILALGSIATHGARFGTPTVLMPRAGSRQDPALALIEACSHDGKDHALRPAALRTARGGVLLAFDDQSALLGRMVMEGDSPRLVLWPAACTLHSRANGKAHDAAWRFEGLAGKSNAVDPRLRVFALTEWDKPAHKDDVAYVHTWGMSPHPNAHIQAGLDALRGVVDDVLERLPHEAGPFAMADGHARVGAPIPASIAAWMGQPGWAGQTNLWPAWLPHRHVPEEDWLVDGAKVLDAVAWIALAAPAQTTALLLMPAKRAHVLTRSTHPYAHPYVLAPQVGGAHAAHHNAGKDLVLLDVLGTLPDSAQGALAHLVAQASGLQFAPATRRAALPEPKLLDATGLPKIKVTTQPSAHRRLTLIDRYGPPPSHLWT